MLQHPLTRVFDTENAPPPETLAQYYERAIFRLTVPALSSELMWRHRRQALLGRSGAARDRDPDGLYSVPSGSAGRGLAVPRGAPQLLSD